MKVLFSEYGSLLITMSVIFLVIAFLTNAQIVMKDASTDFVRILTGVDDGSYKE